MATAPRRLSLPLPSVPEGSGLGTAVAVRPRPAELEELEGPEGPVPSVWRWLRKPTVWLMGATIGCYVWVLICFWAYHKVEWFTSLVCILLVGAISRLSAIWMKNGYGLMQLSFDSFFFGMPLALFCFSGFFITHQQQECEWFIAVPGVGNANAVGMGLLGSGWVTVLSMALTAFKIDRNADGECNELAERSLSYRVSHIAFRMSELAYRITTAVIIFDCIRITDPPIIGPEWGPPFLLGMPYIIFILAYSFILYWANPRVPEKARDDVIAVLVVAITMLGINSVFFLDRSCCREAAARARVRLQRARTCELIIFTVIGAYAWGKSFPHNMCNKDITNQVFGPWVMHHRSVMVVQMLASLLLHHVLLYCHPTISRRLGQPITATGSVRLAVEGPSSSLGQSLRTEESMATVTQMTRTERSGMCQTLVRLGGLGVVARLTGAIELYDVTSFKHLAILGYGAYGVVVLTKREDSPETPTPSSISGQRLFAMKLVNLSTIRGQIRPFRLRTPRELFEREKDIYRRIWQETAVPDPEDLSMASRAGHPFIVKLHYFFNCREDHEFNIVDSKVNGTTVVTPITHHRSLSFHEGLIMEYCEEGSLEDYAKNNFTEGGNVATLDEFALVRLFIAEILLALDFLHRVKQVVYRDLNLSNVFVVKRRDLGAHVKLGDFGFSKKLDEGEQECSVAGTPYWYAPEMLEQHRNGKPLDTTVQGHLALDVFSFGIVVFALAHGAPYLPQEPPGRAHPMCQCSASGAQAPTGNVCCCPGCSTLSTLEWRFPTRFGNACIRDLIRVCIAVEPARRPTTQALRRNPFFTAAVEDERPGISRRLPRIDFGELLSLQI